MKLITSNKIPMKVVNLFIIILMVAKLEGCHPNQNSLQAEVYESSASGHKISKLTTIPVGKKAIAVQLFPDQKHQTMTGFGGSFTESSAYLLNQLSKKNRDLILNAYFGSEGAKYSLTRTHINSCDFSLGHYSYAPVEGDKELVNFSIDEDRDDIIPMIKEAMDISEEGFKIIASPWTAPPWMKDNHDWMGGKLLPEYHQSWALFFSKYLNAYKNEGIDIWGITVENEPLGNSNNWESMHYSAMDMADFVTNDLGPKLEADHPDVKILAYDQNRGKELLEWAKVIYGDKESLKYFDGFAIHWYASTFDWFPESLKYTHDMAPDKYLIQTEACVDSEVPHWQEDCWYWSKEATDWGWDWASEEDKIDHPKYVPVFRYARDIIGCMNNWVDGWVDWNMVLDRQGGPNWFKNWCIAPVIVDTKSDEVYFTPLYYTMAHFSKFIRPGAVRIGFENPDKDLMMTAAQNPDGTIAVVILNMSSDPRNINLSIGDQRVGFQISADALQTIVLSP